MKPHGKPDSGETEGSHFFSVTHRISCFKTLNTFYWVQTLFGAKKGS